MSLAKGEQGEMTPFRHMCKTRDIHLTLAPATQA